MSSGNLKEKTSSLVRITPVETDPNHKDKFGKKRPMTRQWQPDKTGRFFPANLSVAQLKPILEKAKVKLENVLLKDEGDFIVYRYKGRPLIELNVKNGQFYSLASEIDEYGREAVQQQAHIVLDVLKTYGFSGAMRGREVFASSARQLLGRLETYKQGS